MPLNWLSTSPLRRASTANNRNRQRSTHQLSPTVSASLDPAGQTCSLPTGAPGSSTASAHRARSHHGDDDAPESCTDMPAQGSGGPGRLIGAANHRSERAHRTPLDRRSRTSAVGRHRDRRRSRVATDRTVLARTYPAWPGATRRAPNARLAEPRRPGLSSARTGAKCAVVDGVAHESRARGDTDRDPNRKRGRPSQRSTSPP